MFNGYAAKYYRLPWVVGLGKLIDFQIVSAVNRVGVGVGLSG